MLNETKEREREREREMLPEGVHGSPSMRTASDGDHHGAVTDSRCNTLESVCTHG